jgi:hypothetical protein
MTISDMDVKDDAQNVEIEDIEDESSTGNNSWDIVVSKATYIFPTVLVITQILNNFLDCVFLKY